MTSDARVLLDVPLTFDTGDGPTHAPMVHVTIHGTPTKLILDTYEFQVPIFVITHNPPAVAPKQDEHLTFTFVTDGVESAIRQASAAAGEQDVDTRPQNDGPERGTTP